MNSQQTQWIHRRIMLRRSIRRFLGGAAIAFPFAWEKLESISSDTLLRPSLPEENALLRSVEEVPSISEYLLHSIEILAVK